MKLIIEEDGVEIIANKEEIEMAIGYLKDILDNKVPNEVIFKQFEPFRIVTVSIGRQVDSFGSRVSEVRGLL